MVKCRLVTKSSPAGTVADLSIRPMTRRRRRIRFGRKNAAAASAPRKFKSARSAGRPVQWAMQHGAPGVGDQPLQRDDEQIDIVDLAEKRNEVRE